MKRNASMEVLRCLLMLMIVAWHAAVHGIYSHGQLAYACADWTLLPFMLTCWHVDAFVAISGWYGIKFKPSKFLRLLCLMAFYSIINYVVAKRFYGGIPFSVDGGWFGGCYLMLMLCAPILNQAVVGRSRMGIVLLLIGVMLQWFPWTTFSGIKGSGADAYSLFMLICVYLVSRRASVANVHCSSLHLCLAILFLFLGMMVCGGSYVAYKVATKQFVSFLDWQHFSYYNAPHVLLLALVVVVYVGTGRVRVPDWLGSIGVFLAPSMFAVYLMHDVSVYGHDLYLPLQKCMHESYRLPSFLVLSISTVFTFSVCVGIDLTRRMLLWPFESVITRVLELIDGAYNKLEIKHCG